jgi:putative tricarboxylic transport membrane protein
MDFKSFAPGVAFLILGILVSINAYHLGLGSLGRPGPGLFIFLAGSLIVLLTSVDIIKGISRKRSKSIKLASLWQGTYWARAALLLTATVIYALVLDSLGFLLPTFLYIGFCVRLLHASKWGPCVISAILSTSLFYLLVRLFEVPIPPLPEILASLFG